MPSVKYRARIEGKSYVISFTYVYISIEVVSFWKSRAGRWPFQHQIVYIRCPIFKQSRNKFRQRIHFIRFDYFCIIHKSKAQNLGIWLFSPAGLSKYSRRSFLYQPHLLQRALTRIFPKKLLSNSHDHTRRTTKRSAKFASTSRVRGSSWHAHGALDGITMFPSNMYYIYKIVTRHDVNTDRGSQLTGQ